MTRAKPEITSVNGYDVIKASETVFKVYDDDRQYGSDFATFDAASDHANTLPTRRSPRR